MLAYNLCIQNCGIDRLSSSVKTHWLSVSDKLASAGAEMYDVSLPHFHYGVSCYTVLCAAEVSSNFAKYSSLLFGKCTILILCNSSNNLSQDEQNPKKLMLPKTLLQLTE